MRTRCGLLKCVAQHGVHEMFVLLAPIARRVAHAQISMVDRMDVIVHPAAQGISWMNQDEPGRQRRATTSAKTARPFRSTSRTPESAPRRRSRHARSARRDGAAVLADCSSLKGKLSVWLVLRLFSMKRMVDDLSGCRLQAGDLQWRPGPALTLTAEGDEAVMGWDWQVRPKERGETRQAWAMGPRGTSSSGSAHPQSTPPAA